MRLAAVLALAALLAPGYVAPPERILPLMESARKNVQPLRVQAELAGGYGDWPQEVVLELHPELGYRASDDRGGRWILSGGRVVAGNAPAPEWLPELEILVLKSESELARWLARSGVDLTKSGLARHGEADCYVFGGRDADSQLWVDKDRLEVVRWVPARGRSVDYARYSEWNGIRFPSVVELRQGEDAFATLAVHSVARARDLRQSDFSSAWVDGGTR